MYYLEMFLQVCFVLMVVCLPLVLLFALVCEAMGWYDAKGRYCGPFSKARRK